MTAAPFPVPRGSGDGARPLVVTLGDPAGVGPECLARAWDIRREQGLAPFFAVGDLRAVKAVWDGPTVMIDDPAQAVAAFDDALPVWPHGAFDTAITPGTPTLDGTRSAMHALEFGVGLARQGGVAGLVTGPVSKHQLHRVGYTHPGQTEFVAERCGVTADCAVMMLAAPTLRVVPLTIHIPLTQVPAALTTNLIVARTRIVARGLVRSFGIARPRLALAGLNPHAGEGGDIGDEETRIMVPALARLAEEGIDVAGPLPADTLFAPHVRSQYDAILCAYHDQALAPFKALHFADGVNLTLGLPIVRTSPDHGTAFDIAGTGRADPMPTVAALRMATEIAAHRAQVRCG